MDETAQRAAVVAAARSWLRTPFHHRARVKGAGADCGTLVAACFEEAGLVPRLELPDYSPQWHLNRHDEHYLALIRAHMGEIDDDPQPGDVALWRIGRTFSHAAIVVAWPVIIHALWNADVMLDDALRCPHLIGNGTEGEADAGRPRARKLFSYWAMRRSLVEQRPEAGARAERTQK